MNCCVRSSTRFPKMQVPKGQGVPLWRKHVSVVIFPSIALYMSSRVISSGDFASSKPPLGPLIECTRPLLASLWKTLERCASDACVISAISLIVIRPVSDETKIPMPCRAKDVASDIWIIFFIVCTHPIFVLRPEYTPAALKDFILIWPSSLLLAWLLA